MRNKKNVLLKISFWFGYFVLLLFFAIRNEFAFFEKKLFAGAMIIVSALVIANVGFSFVCWQLRRYNKIIIVSIILSLLTFVLPLVVFIINPLALIGYAVEFGILLACTLPKVFILHLAFGRRKNAIIAFVILLAILAGGTLAVVNVAPKGLKKNAVVYAVDNEYQIVWSTYNKGVSYVEVGGAKYYDSVAGIARSDLNVHKVSIPMAVLDAARSYTINTRNMFVRGAYGAIQGGRITKSYDFRPIDESDGIQFVSVADTHDYKKAAVKAASYYGDKLDFCILVGDISSYLSRNFSLEFINKLAYEITGGSRPVIYARGNHECRGAAAQKLDHYVGADGDNFYYTFRLGSLWGVVLDMGEDKLDSHIEYFGAANYQPYRQAQIAYLNKVIGSADTEYNAEGVTSRIAVCHVPTSFTAHDSNFLDIYKSVTKKLNQMSIDVMISGHYHQLMYLEGGQKADIKHFYSPNYRPNSQDKPAMVTTGANFATAVVSCTSDKQISGKSAPFKKEFTTAAFEYKGNELTLRYINTKQQEVHIVSPWLDINYGNKIVIDTNK